MSEETPIIEDDMGNIVSGGKDLLSSSLHWPEGTEEEKSGESLPGKEEQPGAAESETVPEQSSGGDQQQPSGNREDKESEDTKPSTSVPPELQHDRSTESDGSGGERDKQQQQQQRDESSIWDFLVRDIIRKQCEAWDNLTKGGQPEQHSSEDEGDLTIEVEEEEEYHPIVTDDFSILDMFIIKPESVKIKNRNNKKKNKKKKWFRSKKQRKPNGKMHYIIL